MRDRWVWIWGSIIGIGGGVAAAKYPSFGDKLGAWGNAFADSRLVGWALAILLAPGWLPLQLVWRYVLRQDGFFLAVMPVALHVPAVLLIIVFSWIFWSIAWSRFFFFIGQWDPFHPR